MSWRPSRELRARLTAEAARRKIPLGRLIEELCLAGLAEEAEPWKPQPARVPPRRLVEKPKPPASMPEPLKAAVAATGVKPASQVCARERFHRPGRYCSGCGKSF